MVQKEKHFQPTWEIRGMSVHDLTSLSVFTPDLAPLISAWPVDIRTFAGLNHSFCSQGILWWSSWLTPFLGRIQRTAPRTEHQPPQSQTCRQGSYTKMPNECLCGTWSKPLGVISFPVWKAESQFILNNDFSSFHLPVTILLSKTGVLFLLVCAKSHFWQLQTKADEHTAPLEASPLIRSGEPLHSHQGIFLSNTVQWMLLFPSAALIPLCDLKYLMAVNHYSSFCQKDFLFFPTSLILWN